MLRSHCTATEAEELRKDINGLVANYGLSITDVARATGMTFAGVHYVRVGRRRPNADSMRILSQFIRDYVRSHPVGEVVPRTESQNHPMVETDSSERCTAPEGFVMTAAAKVVINALDYCARRHINGAIFGDPGVGKSEAMRYWSANTKHPHAVVFCRAYTCYSKLLHGLARPLGIDGAMRAGELDDALHEELSRHPRLLVIDEADMLNARTLDWLRTLWDESGHQTSFVLLAKPAFYQRLQVAHARSRQDLRQVWRRLAFRKFLSGITAEEMLDYLAQRGLAKQMEPDAAAALHAACGGSFGDLDMMAEIMQQMLDENPKLHGRITAAVVEKAREVRFGADLVHRRQR